MKGYLPLPGPVFVPRARGDAALAPTGVWLDAPPGTPVHAIVGGEVVAVRRAADGGRSVEITGDDGRHYRYQPLERAYVGAGGVVLAGHVVGVIGGGERPGLELSIVGADGTELDPCPHLVGLADPNELGYDAATSSPIDPGDGSRHR